MPVWVEGRMLSRKRGPGSYLQGNLTSPLRETLRKYFFPLAAICLIKMFLDDDKCIVLKVPKSSMFYVIPNRTRIRDSLLEQEVKD